MSARLHPTHPLSFTSSQSSIPLPSVLCHSLLFPHLPAIAVPQIPTGSTLSLTQVSGQICCQGSLTQTPEVTLHLSSGTYNGVSVLLSAPTSSPSPSHPSHPHLSHPYPRKVRSAEAGVLFHLPLCPWFLAQGSKFIKFVE